MGKKERERIKKGKKEEKTGKGFKKGKKKRRENV